MSLTTLSRESLPVPEPLLPEFARTALPVVDSMDLHHIKRYGWARFGIVAAVVDEESRILMLEHRGSDKSEDRSLGPLAETAQAARGEDGSIEVEGAAHTLSRAFFEEVGVANPASLELTSRRVGAWLLKKWPVGISYEGQEALAVCPVVRINREQERELVSVFNATKEITNIAFMHP